MIQCICTVLLHIVYTIKMCSFKDCLLYDVSFTILKNNASYQRSLWQALTTYSNHRPAEAILFLAKCSQIWEQKNITTLPVTATLQEIAWPLEKTTSPLLICISKSNCASRFFQSRAFPAGLLADCVAFNYVARLKVGEGVKWHSLI